MSNHFPDISTSIILFLKIYMPIYYVHVSFHILGILLSFGPSVPPDANRPSWDDPESVLIVQGIYKAEHIYIHYVRYVVS